ncbi:MAG: protease inhibitor I42 family protein [Treponema sp.]|nr:protease inhibitor I42 family protein [Treponema sp.]
MKKLNLLPLSALFFFLVTGFLSCASTAVPASDAAVSEKSDSSTVFVILDSNPSTGYSWSYSIEDKNIVAPVSDKFIQNEAPADFVGVGGKHSFILKGKKEGTTQVVFNYARANSEPIQKRVYELNVASDLSTGLKLVSAE